MKADLERLLISEAELLELTGFDRQKILLSYQLTPRQIIIHRAICSGISVIAFALFASIFLSALRLAGTILLISLLLGGLGVAIELAEVAVVCFGIALAAAIYFLYVLMSAPLGLICLCLVFNSVD
jgi:hypothetical protein